MNTYYLIILFLIFSIFTVNTKAETWKKQVVNQIIDETLSLNDKVYLISHKKERFAVSNFNVTSTLSTYKKKYFISKLDKDGEIEKSVSFESSFDFKTATLTDTGELFVLMKGTSQRIGVEKITIKRFAANLSQVQQKDFQLNTTVDFGKLVFENDYLYLMGIEDKTKLVRIIKMDQALEIEWMEQLAGYPADVEFLNKPAYDIKVFNQNIYLTFNSSKTVLQIGSAPVNSNFTGIVASLNDLGKLNWAKKIHYSNTNYFGSTVLNIVKAGNSGIWVTGNVAPYCFEGCPKSVIYKIDASGNIASTRSLSSGFYNYINEGIALPNGELVLYGFSNDDVFGPPPSFSRSHVFVLDNSLNLVNQFTTNEVQINTAQLSQGQTVFDKMVAFENNSIVYASGNHLLRTNLDDMGCSELEFEAGTTGSVAFPTAANISVKIPKLEGVNNSFSFALSVQQTSITTNNICFDAGNIRLSKDDLFTSITVSPNPTNGTVNIGQIDLTDNVSFSIYNTAGAKMMDGELNGKTLDISNLLNGIYYLNVTSAGKLHNTVKLMKQ